MKEKEMEQISEWINQVVEILRNDKKWNKIKSLKNVAEEERGEVKKSFMGWVEKNGELTEVKREVGRLCKKFQISKNKNGK
jgi:glycine/serine hydroxymethyltransferase